MGILRRDGLPRGACGSLGPGGESRAHAGVAREARSPRRGRASGSRKMGLGSVDGAFAEQAVRGRGGELQDAPPRPCEVFRVGHGPRPRATREIYVGLRYGFPCGGGLRPKGRGWGIVRPL